METRICVYTCRGVKIVFSVNIHISFLPQPHPVDGPQLAWEHSAVKPLSDRYQPRASRYPRLSNARSRCPRLFLYTRYSCMFLSCAYSSLITSATLYPAMNTIANNATCNTTSIIAIMCLLFKVNVRYVFKIWISICNT